MSTALERLHLNRDGALAAPRDGSRAGWYADGTPPGSPGTAIVAGHVTYDGPAVFFRLGGSRPGDRIEIDRADHRTAVFTVTAVRSYPRDQVPDAVYAPGVDATVQLITCGGDYDRRTHRYSDNIVVSGRLTTVRAIGGSRTRDPAVRPSPPR